MRTALLGATEADNAAAMAEFLRAHVQLLIDTMQESPLDTVRAGNLERAWQLADLGEMGPEEQPGPGPEEIERSAMLFQLVDRLPEAQFRVIHMRFVEQKSIREIAQELGRSEGAVKQLQLRAIESLRAQMEGAHA